ncbi:GLPGLI family protein [Pedobacter aquatilis]|uniref:GLPGLI family protein n=1 Tax=Pedobacter aquatilis TaxID=351343 RepID=UPI00292D83EB|nr:GLPGLI family protein [Pedobacter aquatilis]
MKKLILIIFIAVSNLHVQAQAKKTLKVTYISVPHSQYQVSSNDNRPEKEKNLDIALSQGYQSYFTLLVDLKSSKTAYFFDTLIVKKPVGREKRWMDPTDKISYLFREGPKELYKKEEILDKRFYTKGEVADIEWLITNETKEISGFKCQKATSKNKDFLLTAWFTKDIPVSSGPTNYIGLPGLVILAEEYFNTITLQKVEYSEDGSLVNEKIKILKADFVRGNGVTKEPIFMLEKSRLVKSMRGRN